MHLRLSELSESGVAVEWMELLVVRRVRDSDSQMVKDGGFVIWDESNPENRILARQ